MKIKRFSLLAGLATLVTVGSVYATWDYITGGNIEGDSATLGVTITEKTESTGLAGSVDFTSVPVLTIDHAGDYVPTLGIVGDIDVTYTPATGSQVNAVVCTINVEFQDTCTDEFKALFNFTPITWTSTAGTTFTLDAASISSNLSLVSTVLDTPALYDAYSATLSAAGNGWVVTASAVAA